MILHQIEALANVGVKEVVLAVNYQPEVMLRAMREVEEKYSIKITFSIEEEPLGTGNFYFLKFNLQFRSVTFPLAIETSPPFTFKQ